MVDAVDLLLAKQTAEKGVELARRVEVVAEGLLDEHARPAGVVGAFDGQTARGELPEDQLVVTRRNGQVEDLVGTHAPLLLDRAHHMRHIVVGLEVVELAVLIAEQRQESLDVLRRGGCGPLGEDSAHVRLQLGVAPLAAAEADHDEPLGQQPLAHQIEQRRHDLARHEVAGRAKDHQDGRCEVCGRMLGHERLLQGIKAVRFREDSHYRAPGGALC